MRNAKRRMSSILLCLCMLLVLLPATALAGDASVSVTVGGKELTYFGEPVYATTNSVGVVITSGATAENYNIKWDGSTLTLRDATIMDNSYGVKFEATTSLSIVLIGTSTVASRDGTYYGANYSYGIYSAGRIILSGNGTLETKGGYSAKYDSYGIYSVGSITLSDDVTLTAKGSNSTQNSFGIRAENITMAGGVVTAIGGRGISSYGVYADNTILIKGGSLTAEGGASAVQSCGLLGYEALTIEGGVVVASSANIDDTNFGAGIGIRSYKSVLIKGGTVTASGGSGSTGESSYGVYGDDAVAISGGSLIATGGASSKTSYGVYGYQSISISGGDVTATGSAVSGNYYNGGSFGVGSYQSPSISGGSVTATGGSVSGILLKSYGVSCGDSVDDSVSISGGIVEAKGHTYAFKQLETGYRSTDMCTIMASERIDGTLTKVDGNSSLYRRVRISPNVNVGGTNVADGGYWLNDGKGGITPTGASESSYNVAYEDGVLTLSNAYITKTTEWSNAHAAAVCSCAPLTISLVEQSTLLSSTETSSYGIYMADNCSLTITGEGSLAATGGMASGGSTNNSYGVYGNSVTISGGSLTATGGTASNGYYRSNSYGVYANSITVSGGSLTAKGGAAVGYTINNSYGVFGDSVTISGGSLTATGGTASNGYYGSNSYGVYGNNVTVSGGSLTAASCAAESAVTTYAVNRAPDLGAGPWYMWKSNTSSSEPAVDYTRSIHSAYTFTSAHKYLKIADATPIPLTITAPTAASKGYDGSTDAVVTPGAVVSGVVGEDVVNVVAAGVFDSKAAGSDKTVIVTYALIGDDAGNYAAPGNDTVTASISQAPLTVSGTTAADKYYDGTTDVSVTPGTVSGIVSGDKVTVEASGTFDSKAAGSDKTVTVTYALTGDDAGNYTTPANDTVTASIYPIYALTVSLNGGSGRDVSGSYKKDERVEIDAGAKSGYRFAGWTSSNGGEFADADSASTIFTMPNSDTTITARWTYRSSGVTNDCTLRFDTNGGSVVPAVNKPYGAIIDLSDYVSTKTGCTFDGWYADAALTQKIISIKLTRGMTFYAKWNAAGLPFADVKEYDWFYDDVSYVYENKLMNGTGASAFSPYLDTSRGMIVVILYRLADEPAVSGTHTFDDVKPGSYYENAVTWAEANKIVVGYGNGKFGPDDFITREQLASILYRYAQLNGYQFSVGENTNILSYNDAFDISEYAVPAMRWACGTGIIRGNAGNLMPTGGAQRCHAAAMLVRFLNAVEA